MASSAEYEQALNESNKQLKALNEINTNKPLYNKSADQLQAVVNPDGVFSEPKTAYNPKYPYNHAITSESGHSIELDDTPGAERVAITHRTGTFTEIHPDGSKVEKIVNDNVQIMLKDNQIVITGNDTQSTLGNLKVYIKGNAKLQVDGDVELEVKRNLAMHVHGTFSAMADSFNFVGPVNVVGDIAATGNMMVQGSGAINKNLAVGVHQTIGVDLAVGTTITAGQNVTAAGIDLVNHVHTGVTPGGSSTGGPVG
jgi:hypothetical protein